MTIPPDIKGSHYKSLFSSDALPRVKDSLNQRMTANFQTHPALAHVYSDILSAIDSRNLESLGAFDLYLLSLEYPID